MKKLYATYEETPFNAPGERLVLDENGMKKLYAETVNKEEYADYSDWLWDMLRSGVFEEDYPTYRVDSFAGNHHTKKYFYYVEEAEEYAKEEVEKGKIVFLLEYIIDGKYDVVREIK